MNKEDLIIAVHSCDTPNGLTKGLSDGLIKGFTQIGMNCLSTNECKEKDITPNLAIAFDSDGIQDWQKLLNQNITNIMWSTDSVFSKNFEIVQQFSSYKNFILFNPCAADIPAISAYLPSLIHGYIPYAIDIDIEKTENTKKEYNISFFGDLKDPDVLIKELESAMPELVFKLIKEFSEIALQHSYLTLWEISQFFKKQMGLEFSDEQYLLFARNVSDIVTNKQKVAMISALKDFNLTIFGHGPWEKYVSSNAKIIDNAEPSAIPELMRKSKIILHSQPHQLLGGLHPIVLEAAASGAMVLTGHNPTLKAEFSDSFEFCNPSTYDDIAQKADFYLNNSDEYAKKVNAAYEIVKQKHQWSNRAQSIIDIID